MGFEKVLQAIRGAGELEASLRQELVLKDKEHQEELDRAMRALAIKDKQLAAKDEEIQRQLAAKDEENKKQLAVKRRRNPQTTRDVCLILGFQNIKDALFKKVKKAYKTSLHAICETHMTPASNNEGRAVDKKNKWTTLHMM